MAHALAEQKRQFADGIPECGADTLRMALCSYHFKGLLTDCFNLAECLVQRYAKSIHQHKSANFALILKVTNFT